MSNTRRDLMMKTLFGTGGLGLKALATGLPVGFLMKPLAARAASAMCVDKNKAQYLIVSASSAGDPLNANVPGTYDFSDIAHADDPRMAPTQMKLGTHSTIGAEVWSRLAQPTLDRTVFFHHATMTNNHANLAKVMRAMGVTAKQEMLPSLFAKHLASCFGTIQTDPVSAGAGDYLTIDGRSLPNVAPTGLRDLLARNEKSAFTRLEKTRDATVDEIHKLLKAEGTSAQRRFLDDLVISRGQARSLSSDLIGMLSAIINDGSAGQVIAAVALIKMNVSPVVAIRLSFGGDNHTDDGLLKSETPQTEASVGSINMLMTALAEAGLQDRVTFAAYNVFGRTLKKLGTKGRDHWGSHHATVMIGKNLKAGVIGGLEPKASDYYATPIDSKTGRGVPGGGDIPFSEGLSSMGKTLGAALGISREILDGNIQTGKIVTAAING